MRVKTIAVRGGRAAAKTVAEAVTGEGAAPEAVEATDMAVETGMVVATGTAVTVAGMIGGTATATATAAATGRDHGSVAGTVAGTGAAMTTGGEDLAVNRRAESRRLGWHCRRLAAAAGRPWRLCRH